MSPVCRCPYASDRSAQWSAAKNSATSQPSHPGGPILEKRKLALITGASSGIGAAFARYAAANGVDVALAARRIDRLTALADEIRATWPVDAFAVEADLSDPDTPAAIIKTITDRGRSVDILVNNAGFSIPEGFAWSSLARQRNFLAVTVDAPMALAHLVLPDMMANGWGRLINISSIAALSHGGKGHTLYPAGKSFLIKFSQSLNAEMKDHGIFVSAVCPGFVKTEFHVANDTADQMKKTARPFWQAPEVIAEESWRRNDRGVEVIVPGMAPKVAAFLLKALPEPLVTMLTRQAAADHYVGDGPRTVTRGQPGMTRGN